MDRQRLKDHASTIFRAGLDAVDPRAAVERALSLEGDTILLTPPDGERRRFDARDFDRIFIVGGGKATALMSQAVEEIIGDRISGGVIVVKVGHTAVSERVKVFEAAHPVPDEAGRRGAQEALALLDALDERSLVFSLISGGGSALLPAPAEGITLQEKQAMTSLLLEAGADIGEINAIRKHISAVKGGQLARRAAPATVINMMLSDVVGDHLDVIGSGPAVPDNSTFEDARQIFDRHALWEAAPPSISERVRSGAEGRIPDTPKAGDPAFDRCVNTVIGSNIIALEACVETAVGLGMNTSLLASTVEGEAREVARVYAAMAREICATGRPAAPPACLIAGGETTVTIRGKGKGGRNQELALAAALDLDGLSGVAVFSGGTDGTDGPTDAAGAIAFGDTLRRARAAGLDPAASLADNDAYPFFRTLDDLIITGPTGTNVMDVHLVLVSGPR